MRASTSGTARVRRGRGVIGPLYGVTEASYPAFTRTSIRYQRHHTKALVHRVNLPGYTERSSWEPKKEIRIRKSIATTYNQIVPRTSSQRLIIMAETFSSLPILPLSQALDPATKPKFLEDLRHALLNVGFLYLSETGLPDQLIKDSIQQCQDFFVKLPQKEKERIEMKNEKSFLGWSRVS